MRRACPFEWHAFGKMPEGSPDPRRLFDATLLVALSASNVAD